MNEMTKDVEVSGKRYRIGRFRSDIGFFCMSRVRNSTEEVLATIQKHTYRLVQKLDENNTPMPIIFEDGRWADKELEYDTVTVMNLFGEVWRFNFPDFMETDATKTTGAAPETQPLTH